MLARLRVQRAARLRPHAMVERRRIYLPLRALFMLNRCFGCVFPVGFVLAESQKRL
jgi:hypothetical protein